jgi:hypothetical protein
VPEPDASYLGMRRGASYSAVAVAVVLVVVLAACSGSKHATSPPSSAPTPPATSAPSLPTLVAVLDDQGLHLPAGPTLAGHYTISFADRRSTPGARGHAVLQFRPSGPDIVLFQVPAGTRAEGTLWPNEIAQVALDGEPVRLLAIDHQLMVQPTPGFSTPVT